MNIIKQNPFRILGLTGNATERELQKQIGIIKRYAEIEKTKSFDYDFEFIGDFTRTIDEIQQASNRIEQAYKKLLYSLFWFVKNNSFDEIALNHLKDSEIEKATEIWNKTLKGEVTSRNYSSYQNLSTLNIALATVNSQVNMQNLQLGIKLKGDLLHSDNLAEFSKLVTGNGIANNTIEISKKFVDEVIELLKPYLNKSNGITTNELISLFSTFPSSIQKHISAKFTEVPISNIENNIDKTINKRKRNPWKAYDYGVKLYESSKSDLSLLKSLLGENNLQFQILADNLAKEILQCSIDYFNENQNDDENFETYLETSIKLLELASTIAVSNQVIDRVNENLNALHEMKDKAIHQAIALLESVKDAFDTNESLITSKVMAMPRGYNQSINWTKVNQMIDNSVDWDKVVDLVLKTIPPKNVEKIRLIEDANELKKYKSLVKFLMGKLSYTQTNKVKYLAYWRTESTISNVQFTAKSLPAWAKWTGSMAVFILIAGLVWGEEGLSVVFGISTILGVMFLTGWLRNL